MNTLTLYFTDINESYLNVSQYKKNKNYNDSLLMKNKTNPSLIKFIKSVSIRNKNTAKQYHLRLLLFEKFVEEKYNNTINVDGLIQKFKSKEYDPSIKKYHSKKSFHNTSIGTFFDNRFRKGFRKIQIKIGSYNR